MNSHLKTIGRRNRAAIVLAGVLVAGLSACGSADETSVEAGGTSTPTETSSSAPATSADSSPTESSATESSSSSSPTESSSSSSPTESSTTSSSSSSSEAPAEEYVITIKDFDYTVPESVPAGATVTVVNEDAQAHTVTEKGKFDVTVGPNGTGEFVAPEEMGEYDFICLFHGNMKDTLVTS